MPQRSYPACAAAGAVPGSSGGAVRTFRTQCPIRYIPRDDMDDPRRRGDDRRWHHHPHRFPQGTLRQDRKRHGRRPAPRVEGGCGHGRPVNGPRRAACRGRRRRARRRRRRGNPRRRGHGGRRRPSRGRGRRARSRAPATAGRPRGGGAGHHARRAPEPGARPPAGTRRRGRARRRGRHLTRAGPRRCRRGGSGIGERAGIAALLADLRRARARLGRGVPRRR